MKCKRSPEKCHCLLVPKKRNLSTYNSDNETELGKGKGKKEKK
jgi:hypothetical protein